MPFTHRVIFSIIIVDKTEVEEYTITIDIKYFQ